MKEVISMKIYDKEIYKKQESMKMTIIIIVVFLIGFVAGYLATSFGIVGSVGNTTDIPQSYNETIRD